MTGREAGRFVALTIAHLMMMAFFGACFIALAVGVVWLVKVMTLGTFIAGVGILVIVGIAMTQAWADIVKARSRT